MYYAAKKEVLIALYQHTLLTAKQLSVLMHYHVPSIYGMITELRQQGLVRSVPLPFLRKNHVGYCLTAYGVRAAAALTGEEHIFRPKAWEDEPVQLEHYYGVNAFFTSLICSSFSRPQEGLVEWLSARDAAERYAHFKDGGRKYLPLRPDGFGMYVACTQGRLILHVEYDTGTENLSRLQDKLRLYGQVLPGIWNEVESVHVLIVTQSEGRSERIIQQWESLCSGVFLGYRMPQVWSISERNWEQSGFANTMWLGRKGERRALPEMDMLPIVSTTGYPLLGKQKREPSPMHPSRKENG